MAWSHDVIECLCPCGRSAHGVASCLRQMVGETAIPRSDSVCSPGLLGQLSRSRQNLLLESRLGPFPRANVAPTPLGASFAIVTDPGVITILSPTTAGVITRSRCCSGQTGSRD